MEVKILEEAGYLNALRGMSYSFKDRALPVEEWWKQQVQKAQKRAPKLAKMDGGHNKFLESIMVWIDIEAPRYWWSEFDTYRVGTTKQSESTMHTLSKRNVTADDFEGYVDPRTIELLHRHTQGKSDIATLKGMLPEAYLQRRLVVTNYKVLKNIMEQRYDHRLPQWQVFVTAMQDLEHPELLPDYAACQD